MQSIYLRNTIALALLTLVLAATWAEFRTPPPQAPWTDEEKDALLSLWIGNLPPFPAHSGYAWARHPPAQTLGHRLFFDVRLSANGQVSCATCHQPTRRFTDGVALAVGLGVGELNTMSLVGAAHSPWFFWDGRKDSLWSQALSPLENPIEQGIDREAIARLIADDPIYRSGYEEIFGSLPETIGPNSATEVFVSVGRALAAYQHLLMPGESAFDRYVASVVADARMEQVPPLNSGLGGGVPLPSTAPTSPGSARLSDELNAPKGRQRRPTLSHIPNIVHSSSASRRAGLGTFIDQFPLSDLELRNAPLLDSGPEHRDHHQSPLETGAGLPNSSGASARAGLGRAQTEGLRLFIGKAQCMNCHNGPMLSNFEFHNTGVLPAPGKLPDKGRIAGIALALRDPFNCVGPYNDSKYRYCAELRFARTGADLIGARKTPSLRNLGGTAPYMHAGQLGTLAQVLDHYNRARPAIVGHNEAKPLNLLPYELRRLEAFLATLDAPINTQQRWLVPP